MTNLDVLTQVLFICWEVAETQKPLFAICWDANTLRREIITKIIPIG